MKRNILTLFLFLVFNVLAFSQSVNFSDTIYWLSNEIFRYNDNSVVNILSIKDGENRKSDNLPAYFRYFNVPQSVEIKNIELTNVRYEAVPENSLKNVENLDKINEKVEYTAYNAVFRQKNLLKFEIVPLRKNNAGTIERLIYFECKIDYSYINAAKNQKSRTYSSSSKMATGKWYKIKVKEAGIYKITYSQLVEMGFTDFNNIGVFGYGGMLSKKIVNGAYIDDLPERPVYKSSENFKQGDYILFYADEPNNVYYDTDGKFKHEIHNYSEYSYYFISDKGTWKQPITENSLANSDVSLTVYDDYKFLEKDSLNIMGSGRRLFWSVFDYDLTHKYTKSFNDVNFNYPVKLEVIMAASSSATSNFSVKFNNISGQNNIYIPQNSSGAHAKLGIFNGSFNTSSNTFNVEITYKKSTASSKAWLDYISFSFKRNLSLSSGFVQFRDIANLGNNKNTKFVISNATAQSVVWDITDRFNVSKIQGNFGNSQYEFIANTNTLREFIAFIPTSNFPSPLISGSSDVGTVNNQNLHSLGNTDLIIVTHQDFYSQAQELKILHEQYDNMKVVLTTPANIYNEFSSGTPDISAIRNFVKMFYDKANNDNQLPKNLLLFGDGSYYNFPNTSKSSFILTFQSYESLTESSFVSDDFYVFMNENEGADNFSGYIDLGVGRIPANTVSEAQNYVNKVKSYYGSNSYSNWKNNILLAADDANNGEDIFQNSTKELANIIRTNNPVYNVEELYLDDYPEVSTIQGERYPDAIQAFNDAIQNGVFFVNFYGHGSPKSWTHEQTLTINTVRNWRNTNKYPIFVTVACEIGPYDNPNFVSMGEEIILNPEGGGIAALTTTRKVGNTSIMSKNILRHVFSEDEDNNINTIGMSVAYTKKDVTYTGKDYTILGDPAIRPQIPRKTVETTNIKINNNEFSDTIKSRNLVTIEGVIKDKNGNIDENFTGTVYPTVFDKFLTYRTRGNNGYVLEYEAQKNAIFKGQANVVNGRFNFSFMVPVDIAYFYDFGKVSYYASNLVNSDASGYYNSFIIGGSDTTAVVDNAGPEINLFMNDEKFASGGITNENPLLIAKLSDESGINTAGNGIGHDITLVLDDNDANKIVLNKFYKSDLDDFRSGKINYNLSNLKSGYHTIRVKAWDVFNNSGEKKLDFVVATSTELSIDHIFNYPNPFSNNTDFYFAHNYPETSLDVLIQIFTVSGKHVRSINTSVYSNGFQSTPIHWDGLDEFGDNIAKGVYIYKVVVKSPQGKKAEKIEKLMILK